MIQAVYRVATEFDVVIVNIGKEAQERMDRLDAEGCCWACERKLEDGERVTCKNCITCYNAIVKLPRKERQKLIQQGKTASPTGGGRPPANDFTRSLAARRSKR